MKYYVIHDAQGNIISATPANSGGSTSIPSQRGKHAMAELDVPAELANVELKDIAKRLRVDVAAKKLVARV